MPSKQSKAALIRLVETGIRTVGDVPADRFYLIVRDIKIFGSPPRDIVASVVVRFLPSGTPYCCGEPSCYSLVFCDTGADELGEYVRRKMNLRYTVSVRLEVSTEYFPEIEFTALHQTQ